MARTRLRWSVAVCATMFFLTFVHPVLPALAASADSTVPARKPILEMIPKKVAGFVVLSDLSRADKATATLATKARLPIPGPIMVLRMMMTTGLGDAIDTKGSIAALYFARGAKRGGYIDEDRPMPAVFLCPVSDFKKFLAILDEPEVVEAGIYRTPINGVSMLVTAKDGYALLATDENREILDLVLKTKTGIAGEVQPWKKWIDRQIAYVFITPSGLKAFRTSFVSGLTGPFGRTATVRGGEPFDSDQELDFPNFEFEDGISFQEKDPFGQEDEIEAPKEKKKDPREEHVRWKMKRSQHAIEDAINEQLMLVYDGIRVVAVGVRVDDTGFTHLTARCGIKSPSPFSEMLSESVPVSEDLLACLPKDSYLWAGGGPALRSCKTALGAASKNPWSPGELGKQLLYDNNPCPGVDFWPSQHFRSTVRNQCLFFGSPQSKRPLLDNVSVMSWVSDADDALSGLQKDVRLMQGWFKLADESQRLFIKHCKEIRSYRAATDDEETEKEKAKKEKAEKKKKGPREVACYKLSAKETTVDGCKAILVVYDFSEYYKSMKECFGGNGDSTYKYFDEGGKIYGYHVRIDKHRILSSYSNDLKAVERRVRIAKDRKGGLTEDPEVKKMLAMLPADARWKGLWSPAGTARFINWTFRDFIFPDLRRSGKPVPADKEKMPKFQDATPVGVAVVVSKNLLEVSAIIPPEAIGDSVRYYMAMELFMQPLMKSPPVEEEHEAPIR